MKVWIILLVMLLPTLVSADATGYIGGLVGGAVTTATGGTAEAIVRIGMGLIYMLPAIVYGGALFLAALFFLQYIGIDVVGWTIEIFKFFFDNLFLLMRWTLASPENLISMVILFIAFWIVLMFGGPKI